MPPTSVSAKLTQDGLAANWPGLALDPPEVPLLDVPTVIETAEAVLAEYEESPEYVEVI